MANTYGDAIGKTPYCCRTKLETITIHDSNSLDHRFGGGNKNFLIHKAGGDDYIRNGGGMLEAAFMHEGVHTSLDPDYLLSPEYQGAIKADGGNFVSVYARDFPAREDLAETFVPWFITRYRKDKIS